MFFIIVKLCILLFSIYGLVFLLNFLLRSPGTKTHREGNSQDEYIDIDGIDTHFLYAAAKNKTPKTRNIILVHGFGTSSLTWEKIIPHLAETHTIYALDLRGFGYTQKFDDSNYTMMDLGEHLLSFIKKMKIQQPILIGHSMGGGVSLYAAMKNKEIKGIIFENGAPFFKPPVFFKIAALPIFTPFITLFFRLANRYAKNLAEFFFRTAMINKEAISKDLTKRYIAPGTVKGTETVFRNSLKVKPSVFTTQDYQKIECKVLLLRGKKDTIIPLQQVGKLHSILPHSTMMLVPNVGHMLHEEVPEAFINIIKSFVTELS